MDVSEGDLDTITTDKEAQNLLERAARRKAEYWETLKRLEEHVGLSFEAQLEGLCVSIGTPAAADDTNLSAERLAETLEAGFQAEGSVEGLSDITSNETAQQLLEQAVRKKAEYWDALGQLEDYVGLSFEADLTGLVFEIDTPAGSDNTNLDSDRLREELEKGFKAGGDVLDETGIAVPEG